MPTYLTRPVFPFTLDWSTQPKTSWTYDLRDLQLGFGAPSFSPLQSYVVQGQSIFFRLLTEADVAAWEIFSSAILGPLAGFWFPKPAADMQLVGVPDTTHVDVATQDLVSTWDAAGPGGLVNPSIYLVFTAPGQAAQYAKILGVTSVAGNERIHLDAAVTIDLTWSVSRLLYVRMAKDVEDLEMETDGWAGITLDLIELPTEYAAVETGTKPVYFYRFYFGGPDTAPDVVNDWFYTSFQQAVASTYGGAMASTAHAPANITHGAIKDTLSTDEEQCTIECMLDAGTPFTQLVPMTMPQPLWVDIRSADLSAPNVTTVLLTGMVLSGPGKGRHLSLKVASTVDAFDQLKIPRMMDQTLCPYRLYDARTCKVVEAPVAITVTAVSGLVATISGAGLAGFAAGALEYGYIALGSGRTLRRAGIQASTADGGGGVLNITLNQVLPAALVGTTGTVSIGCDLSIGATGCGKFANIVNFGGNPYRPAVTPSLAQNIPSAQKK